ncbi:MAG: S26 family signal peptidase, partial [Bacteroidota bacterium]
MKINIPFLQNKYVSFAIVAILYTLWVIWVGYFLLLIGLVVIFDLYVSKKVNWTFWKKREGKNHGVIEWLDALIFAVIAVSFINIFFFQNYKIPTGSMEKSLLKGDHLFVSKITYGPRIPQTPLHFPFAQNIMPLTTKTKSYLEWIQWPYKRLAGFRDIKRDDVVVFNFPAGDTVILQHTNVSYESVLRQKAIDITRQNLSKGDSIRNKKYYMQLAREYVWDNFDVTTRPVDRRDNYIKRCVAVPGDTFAIKETDIYINGEQQKPLEHVQFKYIIRTKGSGLNQYSLEKIGIPPEDISNEGNFYVCPLTRQNVKDLKQFKNVTSVEKIVVPKGE